MLQTNNSGTMQITKWVLIAITVIVLLTVLWAIRSILLLTLASVILVVFFTIPVRFLARFGVKRTPAILVSILSIILIIFLLARVALPSLIEQFATLTTEIIPDGARRLLEQLENGDLFAQSPFLSETFQPLIDNFNIEDIQINDFMGQIANAAGQVGLSVLPLVSDVATTVLSILIVIFLSMYFLVDPRGYSEGFVKLFPLWYRARIRFIMDRIDYTLRGWLEGTFLSMIFVGVGTWAGLALLNLQQAAALGVIAGVMSFIPNFGQLIAVGAAIVVGIVQAPENLGWIIVVIYGISFIQSQVFSPLLFSESIKLPPVMVLLGQIIAGALFGFIGILLAVPIAAILMIVVQEVYIKDMLGDTAVQREQPTRLVAGEEDLLPDGV